MQFETYLSRNARYIDAYLDSFLKGKATHPDMDRYLYTPLSAYTANGGKRHRPLICGIACEAVGGNRDACMSAAAAIEHFHTAALIHDDIADEALLRRGKPCLHITQGVGLAINAGDLSLSLVTGTVIHDDTLDDATKIRVLKELIDMTARTVEGQALDLGWARDERFDLEVSDYLAMAEHKTAFYSGGVPLAVGAIIGGGTEKQIECLREFGMNTGLAFQIQDDLLNLVGQKEAKEKDFRSDITEGKRTLMVVHCLQHSDERQQLIDILSAHTSDAAMLQQAVDIMERSGSLEFARAYADRLTEDAKGMLDGVIEKSAAYDLLISMADFFVKRMK